MVIILFGYEDFSCVYGMKISLAATVHKQRHSANDFFGDNLQCYNQTDVSLTSASDLETHVISKGRVK